MVIKGSYLLYFYKEFKIGIVLARFETTLLLSEYYKGIHCCPVLFNYFGIHFTHVMKNICFINRMKVSSNRNRREQHMIASPPSQYVLSCVINAHYCVP